MPGLGRGAPGTAPGPAGRGADLSVNGLLPGRAVLRIPEPPLKGLLPGRGPAGRGGTVPGVGPAASPATAATAASAAAAAAAAATATVGSAGAAGSSLTAGTSKTVLGVAGGVTASTATGATTSTGATATSSTTGAVASTTGAEASSPTAGLGLADAFFAGLGPGASGKASRSLRTTGASIVEDAERTNSPISWSLATATLLSIPSSLATS